MVSQQVCGVRVLTWEEARFEGGGRGEGGAIHLPEGLSLSRMMKSSSHLIVLIWIEVASEISVIPSLSSSITYFTSRLDQPGGT